MKITQQPTIDEPIGSTSGVNKTADENQKLTKKDQKQIQKSKRNSGKEFLNHEGKVMEERKFVEISDCNKKCNQKINTATHYILFNDYWGLGTREKRKQYLSTLINVSNPKRVTLDTKKKRSYTFIYNVMINNQVVVVCKNCFLAIFSETIAFVNDVCSKKILLEDNVAKDNRGGARKVLSREFEEKYEEEYFEGNFSESILFLESSLFFFYFLNMNFIDDTPLDISMNISINADNADDSRSDLAILSIARTGALADSEIIVPGNEIRLAFVISS
jgi:hypothetical protein